MKLDRYEIAPAGRRRLSEAGEQRGSQVDGFSSAWGAFAFSSVFVVAGTLILLVGTRLIPVDPKGLRAPWWVLTVFGTVLALAGSLVWGKAWKQFAATQRRREIARQHSAEPALVDYGWDPRGFAAPRWKPAATALGGALFMTLFLSIFNWWAFFAEGAWQVKAIVILFDLILLAVWGEAGIRWGRALKFGGSRVEFAHFPYRLTEPVVIHWQPATGIVQIRQGTFTLRCVEEWFEQRDNDKDRSRQMVHEEIWSGTWHQDQERALEPGKRVELRFDLPAAAPPTCLSAAKPIFWELAVKLDLPGLDFAETYLVPIYAAR